MQIRTPHRPRRRDLVLTLAASAGTAAQETASRTGASSANGGPEVAVVTRLGAGHRLLQSLVSQLIEQGVHFQPGPGRALLSETPDTLASYRAILYDGPAYDQAFADPATVRRLEDFVRNGGYLACVEDPVEGPVRTNPNLLIDLMTSHHVHQAIVHAGLAQRSPELAREQAAYPDHKMLAEMKAALLKRLGAMSSWNEYTLHDWKAALALLRTGKHSEVRGVLIDSIRSTARRMPVARNSDAVGGYFAAGWLAAQTGERQALDQARENLDVLVRYRPRQRGAITRSGYLDDPLGVRRAPGRNDDTSVRRHAFWTEDLHFYGPAFSAVGRVTGESKYTDEAIKVFEHIARHHIRPDGLIAHCTYQGRQVSGAWIRGQTHALYGMLYMLEELPAASVQARRILEVLARVGKALPAFQDKETGLWRNLVDEPRSRLESSGSVGIFTVFARCVNEGWLPRAAFEPMLKNAWRGLKLFYWRSGMAANCRGTAVGADAAYYLARPQGWAWMPQLVQAIVERDRLWDPA